MLLENLLSCTPADDGTNTASPNLTISAALEIATNLASELNERKRESEGRQRLLYWQGRIGNKFRSPLVQPHRTLLKEGSMVLTRVVKRTADYVDVPIEGRPVEATFAQVHSLKVETQNRPILALLTSDILVLIKDDGDANGQVELFTVLRLGQTTKSRCASAFGGDAMLR